MIRIGILTLSDRSSRGERDDDVTLGAEAVVALGTEGDVCTAPTDCASGFACTGNVCLKAK